ncbi:phosphotransferase family protein [Actinoallomurus liliacearum]|uniref:phosphotransferase family protein n=1 Tax=Actinoallomurus liliacearum TaxID=1080073 RepID=UPI0031F14D29
MQPEILDLLSDRVLDGGPVVGERPLSGGFSTDNVLLRTAGGEAYVLRRYQRRNTCAVEAAVMRRVSPHVPVPEVVLADEDGSLVGEPLLITRFVPGVSGAAVFAGAALEDGPPLAESIATVLAAIGSVTFPAAGFFSGPELRTDAPRPKFCEDLPAFVEDCLAQAPPDLGLSREDRAALVGLAREWAPLVAQVRADPALGPRLVHSDFNPKNLLLRPSGDGWRVSAVLDWEYAFADCALFDVGNLLRFGDELPPGFIERFPSAYREAGGVLPSQWRQASRALDLFAIADLLTRPADHPLAVKAAHLAHSIVAAGR